MDFTQLRTILETEGGKVIIIEEGKAPLLITTVEDYAKKLKEKAPQMVFEPQLPSTRNSVLPKELEEEPLKIEDLPV